MDLSLNDKIIFQEISVIAITLIALFFDLKYQKVPNFLIVIAIIFSFMLNLSHVGLGLKETGLGLIFGFALFFPLYALKLLGAGDVKLFATVGSFLGINSICYIALYTLLAGFFLASLVLIKNKKFLITIKTAFWGLYTLINPFLKFELPKFETTLKTPFVIAILTGIIITLHFNFLK